MDGAHTLVIEAEGARPTVTKSGSGTAAPRLRVEAAILAAVRHPGVVSLIGTAHETDADGTVRVRTRFVGSRTLANVGPLSPPRAAALVAATAGTVADLHDLGVVHGRLTPDHLIVATDDRPVLCGFAEASHGTVGHHRPADDVAALGALLRDLVASSPPEVEEPPTRRLLHRRPPAVHLRGSLLNLADQATAEDPRRRPTARQFAAAVSATINGNRTTHVTATPTSDGGHENHLVDAPTFEPTERPSVRRSMLLVGAVSGALLLVGAVTAATGRDDSGDHDTRPEPEAPFAGVDPGSLLPEDSPPLPGADATVADPTTTTSTTEPPDTGAEVDDAAGCAVPGVGDGSAASLADGTPCPAALAVEGSNITIEGATYRLSTERPAVAVGDFACDGAVRPAVLDLERGHVFVFDHWAGERRPGIFTQAVATVESPRQVLAEPTGDGCHRLVVLDTWGLRHEIDVPPTEEPDP